MFLKVGNKVITQGGKFVEKKFNTLTFTVDGDRFPKIFSYYPAGGQLFKIFSSSPNTVEINWGDGNVINYDFIPYSGEYYFRLDKKSAHIFEDGNTGFRNIVMTFKTIKSIYRIQTLRAFLGENFPTNVLAFRDLEGLILSQGTGIKNFPTNLSPLQKLTNFELYGSTIEKIPQAILKLNIERLVLRSSVDLSKPFSETNFDRVNVLQNTLKNLDIGSNNITSFPSNFSELNIESLIMDYSKVGTLPPEVYNIKTLKTLRFYFAGDDLESFDNFDLLPQTMEYLTMLTKFVSPNINTNIPDLSGLINLKTFRLYGDIMDKYTAQGSSLSNIDNFINRIYDLIILNASKITGNTQFRQMNFLVTGDNGNLPPSGIYQQPTGFILGSENGNPQTPLERMWLMVNQYEHTWNYSQ
jgi:hypothetical protein